MDLIVRYLPRTEEEFLVALEAVHVIGAIGTLVTAIHPIPYGRYSSQLKLTGWTISARTLWRAFSITWILPLSIMLFTHCRMITNYANVFAVSLFMAHYIYRSLIYPSKCMKNASDWPIESAITAVSACALNGFIQGYHLLHVHKVRRIGASSIVGFMLFALGLIINISHDEILADLRAKPSKKKDQTSRYSIPRGGLFDYVSAANYFGEIVEWWGWAIFCGGFPQIIFGITTSIIIGVRGWQHHQFYKRTFGSVYPKNRKAVVPFLI